MNSHGGEFRNIIITLNMVLQFLLTAASSGSDNFMNNVQDQIQKNLQGNMHAAQRTFAAHQDQIDKLKQSIPKMADMPEYTGNGNRMGRDPKDADDDFYRKTVFVSGSASATSDGQRHSAKATGSSSHGPCTVKEVQSDGGSSAYVHCESSKTEL